MRFVMVKASSFFSACFSVTFKGPAFIWVIFLPATQKVQGLSQLSLFKEWQCCTVVQSAVAWVRSVPQRPAVKGLIDHEPVGYFKVSDPLGCGIGEGQACLEETLSLGAVFEGTPGVWPPSSLCFLATMKWTARWTWVSLIAMTCFLTTGPRCSPKHCRSP